MVVINCELELYYYTYMDKTNIIHTSLAPIPLPYDRSHKNILLF